MPNAANSETRTVPALRQRLASFFAGLAGERLIPTAQAEAQPAKRRAATAPAKHHTIEKRFHPPASIGRGAVDERHRAGVRRIVVTAEEELFERIRARAVGKRVSLAEEIRHLLKCGLDAGSP